MSGDGPAGAYVVAPAGLVDLDALQQGLRALSERGVRLVVDEQVRARRWLTAGSDEERAAAFTRAWLDPSTSAVLCADGGYGSAAMLPHVPWAKMRGLPGKAVHGSSDVTALHEAVRCELGVTSWFSPMPVDIGKGRVDPGSVDRLAAVLTGVRRAGEAAHGVLDVPVEQVHQPGYGEGVLRGGTLSILAAGVGTPWGLAPREPVVLAVEDVGEASYRLDRAVVQLEQAGWLRQVRGVVVGHLEGCDQDAREVLCGRLSRLGVPVVSTAAFGHGRRQQPLPLGSRVSLDTAADPALDACDPPDA